MHYQRLRVTENLLLDLNEETWHCAGCSHPLISAREPYKHGCLVAERDPREVHRPVVEGEYTFCPDPAWVRIVEFYCPACGKQIETEYLPPGHPITADLELDLASIKRRLQRGELVIKEGHLWPADDVEAQHG